MLNASLSDCSQLSDIGYLSRLIPNDASNAPGDFITDDGMYIENAKYWSYAEERGESAEIETGGKPAIDMKDYPSDVKPWNSHSST